MPLLSFPGNLLLGAMEESLCRQLCDQHHVLLSPTVCSLTNSKKTHALYAVKSRWEQSALPTCTLITTKHVRSPHREGTETTCWPEQPGGSSLAICCRAGSSMVSDQPTHSIYSLPHLWVQPPVE